MRRPPLIPSIVVLLLLAMSAVGIFARVFAKKPTYTGSLGPVIFATDFSDDVILILETCPDKDPTDQSVWTPVATASLGAFHSASSSTSLVPAPDFAGSARVRWAVNATLGQSTDGNQWVVREDLTDIEITDGKINGTLGFTASEADGTIALALPLGGQSLSLSKRRGMFMASTTDLALAPAPPAARPTIPTPAPTPVAVPENQPSQPAEAPEK